MWNNFILNDAPTLGDDGIACVTYGPSSTRCGAMDWWGNTVLHSGWGRGYSVIGGDDIHIHDNWAIGAAGAGIIIASEGSYNSASSSRITVDHNTVTQCGHTIGHPGILISGMNASAEPLSDLALEQNVSADNIHGAYRAEGDFTNVVNTEMSSDAGAFPAPLPSEADVHMADTGILRTRDTSHVAAESRRGLYRIHVRANPAGGGFQQRFEYVFQGALDDVTAFVALRRAQGDHLV